MNYYIYNFNGVIIQHRAGGISTEEGVRNEAYLQGFRDGLADFRLSRTSGLVYGEQNNVYCRDYAAGYRAAQAEEQRRIYNSIMMEAR